MLQKREICPYHQTFVGSFVKMIYSSCSMPNMQSSKYYRNFFEL